MPFLSHQGAELFYEIHGSVGSKRLTLINGHGRSVKDFLSLNRFLVDRGWQVLCFDNRGAGRTRHTTPRITLELLAKDVLALWRHLGWQHSGLLGISLGGVIAAHAAVKAPSALSFLVLVSTPLEEAFLKPPQTLHPDEWLSYFSAGFRKKNPLLVKGFLKEALSSAGTTGSTAQREALKGFTLKPALNRISAPTLVIHGTADAIVPFTSAEQLRQLLPKAELFAFPHMGHLLIAEAKDALYEAVANFGERFSSPPDRAAPG